MLSLGPFDIGSFSILKGKYFGPHDEWNEDSQRIRTLYFVHLGPHKMFFLGSSQEQLREVQYIKKHLALFVLWAGQ